MKTSSATLPRPMPLSILGSLPGVASWFIGQSTHPNCSCPSSTLDDAQSSKAFILPAFECFTRCLPHQIHDHVTSVLSLALSHV
jgi:hypothetical protein